MAYTSYRDRRAAEQAAALGPQPGQVLRHATPEENQRFLAQQQGNNPMFQYHNIGFGNPLGNAGGAMALDNYGRRASNAAPVNWLQSGFEGFGGQMAGAMGQIGSLLGQNAAASQANKAMQVPLQMEQMKQQGQTQRLGMLSPLIAALFGRGAPVGGGGGGGGSQNPMAGFSTNFGQAAFPAGGGAGYSMSPEQQRELASLAMMSARNQVARQMAGA